jgi:hypothetical protein
MVRLGVDVLSLVMTPPCALACADDERPSAEMGRSRRAQEVVRRRFPEDSRCVPKVGDLLFVLHVSPPQRLVCTRYAKRLKIRLQIRLRALEQHHELLLLPAQPADLRDT